MRNRTREWSHVAALVLGSLQGELPVRAVCEKQGIARATFYRWRAAFIAGGMDRLAGVDRERRLRAEVASLRREVRLLARERDALKGENLLLRTRLTLHLDDPSRRRRLGRQERAVLVALVRAASIGVRRAMQVLGLPRSTFYTWLRPRP